MNDEPDDDALSWAGDEDATLAPGWKRVGSASTGRADASAAATPADAGRDTVLDDDGAPDDEASSEGPAQLGSVELVVFGVLGGVFLLYTVGWIVTVLRSAPASGDPLGAWLSTLGGWLAVAAPAAWFLVAVWLTRGHRVARIVWLVAGAVVLVPVPFLFGIGVSA